ncbi:MAG: ATP-binding protein [Saccharofermentanales bacterium]
MLKKIYALIISVLFLSIIIAGWASFKQLNDYNNNANQTRLHSVINFVSGKIKENRSYTEINASVKAIFDTASNHVRITVIDFSGKVIYDNEADASKLDNHFYRTEVYQAFKSKSSGFAIRKSDTLKKEIFYLAEYRNETGLIIRAAVPLTEYSQIINMMRIQILVIFAVTFTILALTGIFVINIVSRPLKRLEKASLDIAKGNYSTRIGRIDANGADITKVSSAFNKMAEQLDKTIKELDEKNIQLDTILNMVSNPIIATDKDLFVTFMNKAANDEFIETHSTISPLNSFISVVRNNEAEQFIKKAINEENRSQSQIGIDTRNGKKVFKITASPMLSQKGAIVTFQDITQTEKLQQMRTEFVENVTHELRTPLTSIRGFIETLRNGASRDPLVCDRFLEIIDVEAERLHKLISDILSLSEIEEMKENTDSEVFDMNPLIDEIIVLIDDEAASKKVSIITEEIEGAVQKPFLVKANRNRIKQVLINLVENAVKYNIENGKVYIKIGRNEKDEVVLKVEDTGYGIPKEHLPRIFERFYRVDKSRSKDLGGTGLGLSIVKHIAMLYGGSASAESTIGKGSVFTVIMKI